jgi:hypothetical protein
MRKYPRKKTRRRERGLYCTIFSARVQNVDWIGTLSEVMPGEKTRYTFKDGVLVKSEGEIGKMFWKALKALGDPNMCKFAELAIGMNPYTRKGLTSLRAPNLVMTVPPPSMRSSNLREQFTPL